MAADGSTLRALRYRCAECKTPTHIGDLNGDMLCEACGEPDADPDNEEPTALELWKTERTW